MKIEKINDHQIRCTLTRTDLSDRQIDFSELAYGSEKTQQLFRDMMEQANKQFGFDAEDIPIVVDAIPVSNDCLMLVITKVENPDELDPRFARFAPFIPQESPQMGQGPQAPAPATLMEVTQEEASRGNTIRIFRFPDLDSVSVAASVLRDIYFGINTLYKDPEYHDYYLTASKSGHSVAEFNRVCNILTEYSSRISCDLSTEGFLSEHFDVIIADKAIQVMANL